MNVFIKALAFSLIFTALCSAKVLKLSQVLYRHGQRSPAEFYPKDPNKKSWPEGLGQLTDVGKTGEYKLGQFLRKRYNENNFLNKTFRHSDINVRSTDVDRTLESAQLVLAGLYPPAKATNWNKTLLWQPIAVHTVPRKEDNLLQYTGTDCPYFWSEYEKAKSEEPMKSYIKKYQSLYKYLSDHAGMKVNQSNFWIIYDDAFNERINHMKLPAWVVAKMKELAKDQNENFGLMVPNKTLKKMKGGPLVKKMISNVEEHIKNSSSIKMYQFSAHDTTLGIFMSALDIYNKRQPPYSSAIMFELFQVKKVVPSDVEDAYSIQISYRNDSATDPYVLTLKGCAQLCPLKTFKSVTKDIIPEDVEKECHTDANSSPETRFQIIPLTLFIAFVKTIMI